MFTTRRAALLSISAAALMAAQLPMAAPGHAAGDPIRKLVLLTAAQAADPQEYQAAQLIAQEWRKLGLDVEVRGLPRPQLSDLVWYNRQKWDTTMWRMVGRPERSDPGRTRVQPVPLVHGGQGLQLRRLHQQGLRQDRRGRSAARRIRPSARCWSARRRRWSRADAPYVFLVHPKNVVAFNWPRCGSRPRSSTRAASASATSGPSSAAEPAGDKKDMIVNSTEALNSINPLYISGSPDSWVTELVWDRAHAHRARRPGRSPGRRSR